MGHKPHNKVWYIRIKEVATLPYFVKEVETSKDIVHTIPSKGKKGSKTVIGKYVSLTFVNGK